jgi:hypothetical protein
MPACPPVEGPVSGTGKPRQASEVCHPSISRDPWIPVFTGMKMCIIMRYNLLKIISSATASILANFLKKITSAVVKDQIILSEQEMNY